MITLADSSIRIEYPDVPRTDQALSPLTIDCCRSVFAAFLWHEDLVGELIKWSESTQNHSDSFQHLLLIWHDVLHVVQQVIEQQLILPSPHELAFRAAPLFTDNDELCELCEELYAKPVTHHMRVKHPGCGRSSEGHGYNSIGKYTSGWSGKCGDGGKENAVWYLLCQECRNGYMKKPARILKIGKEGKVKEHRPEVILKRNAMFLMELKPAGGKKTCTERVKIELYPQVQGLGGQMDERSEENLLGKGRREGNEILASF